MVELERLDHLVLTVADIARTCAFYERVLGMRVVTFGGVGNQRHALNFGDSKINLHQAGNEFEPKALQPTPGSADLCFTTATPLTQVIDHLRANSVTIIEGPVVRTGANGRLNSIYLRDPDGNLIEVAHRLD